MENRDDFNKWCDQWDKAQKDGLFKDVDKQPDVLPSQGSFFGLHNTHPTEEIKDTDAKYWNDIYKTTKGEVVEDQILQEKDEDVARDNAKIIGKSANPIKPISVGKDQAMEDGPLSVTYSNEDLEELNDLKLKLHELKVKLSSFEGLGKKTEGLDKQIKSLEKEIDEFSDSLGQAWPDQVTPFGD